MTVRIGAVVTKMLQTLWAVVVVSDDDDAPLSSLSREEENSIQK